MSSPEAGLLGRVVPGFPKPQEYTNSSFPTNFMTFWSIVERAECDAQSKNNHLWDGLNLQALESSMLPLVSSALYILSSFPLLHFLLRFFVFCIPLYVPVSLSFALPVHGFKAIRDHGCSVPLPPPSDRLL